MIPRMCTSFKFGLFSYIYMGSSSEIVKAPVTPSKKRTRTTPPSPGTPEFVSLPAVSLVCVFIVAVYLVLGSSVVGVSRMRLWLGVPLKVPLLDQYSEPKLPLFSFVLLTSAFHRPTSEGHPKYVFTLQFFCWQAIYFGHYSTL